MNHFAQSPLGRIRMKQWLALPLSVALGGLLVALLLAALRPGAVLAAPAPEPAAVYACDQSGLNNALAAGGSATFSCGAPTTVPISIVKVVNKNVTLDGGNKLTLSGGNMTGVFTVAAGVRLNLINLTLRDASGLIGAAVFNNGFVAITHTQFISNIAAFGAALFNAPGAQASIAGSSIVESTGKGGAVWNGGSNLANTIPATLTIASSTFLSNSAGAGAAIFNQAGPLIVSGSGFTDNAASTGGAIVNFSTLHLDSSSFFFNRAGIVLDSQAQAIGQAAGLNVPAGLSSPNTGGAIYASTTADTFISTSSFQDNLSGAGGGAVFFGVLPFTKALVTSSALSIANSTFLDNCTGGPGGAVSGSLTTTVSDSSFDFNFADSSNSPCLLWAASHLRLGLPAGSPGPAAAAVTNNYNGAGGAIFNSGLLAVNGSNFIDNGATVTVAGGGGAIANYSGSGLRVGNSSFAGNLAMQDGGAIYNDNAALATLSGSDFKENSASNDSGGAVASLGVLTVTNSTFTGNSGAPGQGPLRRGGGAIFSGMVPIVALGPNQPNGGNRAHGGNRAKGSAPTAAPQGPGPANFLFVDHSSFNSNFSAFEGGALDAGPATVVASSFANNTAAYGGAIDILNSGFTLSASTFTANAVISTTEYPASEGGAIDTFNSSITAISIVNSTFFANLASTGAVGGAINGDGNTYMITNSTFLSNTAPAGQGGAFSADGNFVLRDSLVAFNTGGNCQSALTLSGANLEFPGTTCGGASVQANPLALAPAPNGGPTLTSALLPGSPAINAGDNHGCPSTDQRGAHRPVGPKCDLGAFEFGGSVPFLWLPIARK